MKIGKVYFVEAPGRIKIGYTLNPDSRLQKLRDVDMETLKVIAIIDGTRRLERHLHETLAAFRLKAEWFLDCAAVRTTIAGCLASKDTFSGESPAHPLSVLDEAIFVTEASEICARLIKVEVRNGASTSEALSIVAIKTGVGHNRIWQLHYRKPKSITAAEIFALRKAARPQLGIVVA